MKTYGCRNLQVSDAVAHKPFKDNLDSNRERLLSGNHALTASAVRVLCEWMGCSYPREDHQQIQDMLQIKCKDDVPWEEPVEPKHGSEKENSLQKNDICEKWNVYLQGSCNSHEVQFQCCCLHPCNSRIKSRSALHTLSFCCCCSQWKLILKQLLQYKDSIHSWWILWGECR